MILLIDNYDSFVYNLYQFITEIEPDVKVVRNDEITSEEILKMNPDKIVISPGPGKPSEAGECIHVIRELKGKIPILGVCLGHQAIAEAFGATVGYAKHLMHGKRHSLRMWIQTVFYSEDLKSRCRWHAITPLQWKKIHFRKNLR